MMPQITARNADGSGNINRGDVAVIEVRSDAFFENVAIKVVHTTTKRIIFSGMIKMEDWGYGQTSFLVHSSDPYGAYDISYTDSTGEYFGSMVILNS